MSQSFRMWLPEETNIPTRLVETSLEFTWGIKIPLPDGGDLLANLYRPKDIKPFPVVLNVTPYTADVIHNTACYFAHNGYVFVVVNSRGRGGSDGHFDPLVHEM